MFEFLRSDSLYLPLLNNSFAGNWKQGHERMEKHYSLFAFKEVCDAFFVECKIGSHFSTHIKINTLSDNISSSGLYIQLPHYFDAGKNLFTFTRLLNGTGLAAKSKVVRIDEKQGHCLE